MHYQPLCPTGLHKCKTLCVSPKCIIHNPFICETCKHTHQKTCEIIPYKEFIKKIHVIVGLNKKELYRYEQRIQNTFSQLMGMLKKEFVKFREEFEHFNATQQITDFYLKIRKEKCNQLTGKFAAFILATPKMNMIDYKLKNQVVMRSLRNQIIELQAKVTKKLPPYYSLSDQLEQQSIQFNEEPNRIKQIEQKYVQKRKFTTSGLLKQCIDDVQKMIGKEIYNVQIAFRASENDFSAKLFHKKCDGMKDTLTIAKTQFGNIVGGYCSIPWQTTKNWQYFQDKSKRTFLFSTSKNLQGLKFQPFKTQFTIGMHPQYGPSFGDDFVIYDKASTSKSCWSNFPDVYICKSTTIPHNSKVIKQFVGVDDHYKKFNLIEWQVYKISYQKQQQAERSFMKQYRQI